MKIILDDFYVTCIDPIPQFAKRNVESLKMSVT